jgi:transmembrane sensor
MDELARGLAAVRDEVVPVWSDARSDKLLAATRQLGRRRRRRKLIAGAATVLSACGVLYLQFLQPTAANVAGARGLAGTTLQPMAADSNAEASAAALGSKPAPLQLADGSQVQMLTANAELGVERDEPRNVQLNLTAGAAHFEVVPNKQRQFVVRSAGVEVFVVGTVFDVERQNDRVRVAVSRGKVRVHSALGTLYLQAGESSWFGDNDNAEPTQALAGDNTESFGDKPEPTQPFGDKSETLQSAQPTAASTSVLESKAGSKQRGARAGRHSGARDDAPRWRSLSQGGDYESAYQMLAQGTIVEDDSEALLDAADAARLSGHPEDSLKYLRSVLTRHRSSPVAPLAAFTLGRVLLERLGEPTEAAAAFATARELAPVGSLAQDALAREVEAWSKGGHPQEAYDRARLYVSSYPEGRRLRAVQLYGGLRGL